LFQNIWSYAPHQKKNIFPFGLWKGMIVNIPLSRYDAKRRGVDNQFDALQSPN
jgi:hypothetical protein